MQATKFTHALERRTDVRKTISGMQISADGYIEDPEAKQDWVDNWEEDYGLLDQVDTCILGSTTYVGGYEQYWRSIFENPEGILTRTGKPPTAKEIVYAKWAEKTPHIVVSKKPLDVTWKNTRVIPDLEEIKHLKQQPGKDMYVVGGAMLVASMINSGLIDEIRLMINSILLGGGKALFKGVTERYLLKLESVEPAKREKVYVIYSV
jgi:dihydrofolate reductase